MIYRSMRHIDTYEMLEGKGPCWTGYKQIGTKTKKGKRVPRCVPIKEGEITPPPGWQIQDSSLYKRYTFKDFKVAMAFMNQVAEVCNQMNHHPKWTNIYKTVQCWLRTHDAGDVPTEKDLQLAQAMDGIALKYSAI